MKIKITPETKNNCIIDVENLKDGANQNQPIQSIKKLTRTNTPIQFKIFRNINMTIDLILISVLLVRGFGMTGMAVYSIIVPSSQYLHFEQRVRVHRNDSTSNNIICDNELAKELEYNATGQNITENCYKTIVLPNDLVNFGLLFMANLIMIMTAVLRFWIFELNRKEPIPNIKRNDSSGLSFGPWFWIGVMFILLHSLIIYAGVKLERKMGTELHVGVFVFINDNFGMYSMFFILNLFIVNDAFKAFAERRYEN